MIVTKPRKACNICYQKKIRCNWSEDTPICSYCMKNGLECLLPNSNTPAPRLAVRDKLAEFDARLQRLENESKNPRSLTEFPHSPKFYQDDRRAALITREHSSSSTAILATHDILGANPLEPDGLASQLQLASVPNPELNSSQERRSVRRFRGDTTAWEILVDGTAAAIPSLARSQFNETVNRLAEESLTKPVFSSIKYDLLKEFPGLSALDIHNHTQYYRREAIFPIVYWPSLKVAIEKGLATKQWACWGEIVCVLLFISFGSSHLKISDPQYASEIYFQKAWNMLPQLLFEQDLWALKGLTLMVHYFQGSSLPEPCYTLLGSASRMAISLGFHRRKYEKAYTAVEEEQGRRCWWLCFVLEKTFSLILGRPNTGLELYEAEVPRNFSAISVSNNALEDGNFSPSSNTNDEEAVGLFVDLIELVRTREEIMGSLTARRKNSSSRPRLGTNYENVAELLLHWRAASKLKRSFDFDTTKKSSLRETVCDLAYYNTIICLDRRWNRDFGTVMAFETIQSARATIRLISGFHTDGTTMCLWMWLYYGFAAAVVLFLDVINNPLHAEAMLNVALISDVEALCHDFSNYSPGAKRVMEVSKEMNKVALELIKSRAKRKAEEDLTGSSKLKQQLTTKAGSNFRSLDSGTGLIENQVQGDSAVNEIPPNFSWDDWDQWINDTYL